MKKIFLLIPLLMFSNAWAQDPAAADDPAVKIAERIERMSERLALSDEQREQMREILTAGFERQRSVMESHGVTPESQAAGEKPKRREMRALRRDMKEARETTDKQVATVLSEEQMREYVVMREEMQSQMRDRIKQQQ